jgi:hypothetical protein
VSGDLAQEAPLSRLFVAIDLPEDLKARLGALRSTALPARWAAPENFCCSPSLCNCTNGLDAKHQPVLTGEIAPHLADFGRRSYSRVRRRNSSINAEWRHAAHDAAIRPQCQKKLAYLI